MGFRVVVMGMFDDAFADLEGEVQSAKGGIALLEIFHDTEGAQIVIEIEAGGAHGGVESLFAGGAERGMADVVDQGQRLGEVDVEADRSRNGAGDLRDFERVREAVAEMIRVAAGEDLSFRFEAAESAGMNDAVAVALKVVAVGVRRFRETASAGVFYLDRVAAHGERIALLIVDC